MGERRPRTMAELQEEARRKYAGATLAYNPAAPDAPIPVQVPSEQKFIEWMERILPPTNTAGAYRG